MKFNRKGMTTTTVAAIAVVAIIVVGAGAYLAASSAAKTTTTTVVSTATSVSTSVATSVSTAVSTATSVSTLTSTSAYEPSATLNAAGSTLIFPLMSAWTFAYSQVQPNVQVNYASVGSGTGLADIEAQTVNLGATDAPPTTTQYSAMAGAVVTIPDTISAVVPAYNIPGLTIPSSTATTVPPTGENGLQFTGAVLAGIYLGTITMWNDPAIAAINPGVTLPAHAITVVHRSDGSGTMYAFTQYLSDASKQWATQVGFSTSVAWPTGIGCKGNEGVAGCVENTPYSIGPLEIAYALENPTLLSVGTVQNAAGNYITASDTTIAAAVQAGASAGLPKGTAQWSSVSIANAVYNDTAATTAYPISTFSYLVVYLAQSNQQTGTDIVNFLWWVVNDAQSAGTSIGYIPLPANVITIDDASINAITYGGTSICGGSC